MKKVVTLILIFVMILSIPACKRADFEDTALPFDTTDEGTSENEKTPENEKPQPEIQKQKGDKAEPCSLTLENAFSEYEVIVTLTKEETAKNKTYTEKDFESYDIFYVLENDEYYGNPNMKDSYPEYQNKTTLFLYLNSPSKENVLKTVKNLEKDKRVFAACPNPFKAKNMIFVHFKKGYTLYDFIPKYKNGDYSPLEFEHLDSVVEHIQHINYPNTCADIRFKNYGTSEPIDAISALPLLKNYDSIEYYKPIYASEQYTGKIVIEVDEPNFDGSENYYSEKDLPEFLNLDISKIYTEIPDIAYKIGSDYEIAPRKGTTIDVHITFNNATYQALADAIEQLKKDSTVINIYVN